MADVKTKRIGIRFDSISSDAESAIWSYITRELAKKNISVRSTEQVVNQRRESFRVKIRDVKIKVITEYTQKLPQQELTAEIEDLSVGGICICIAKQIPIAKGGSVYLYFDFCQAGLSVRGTILGLRGE